MKKAEQILKEFESMKLVRSRFDFVWQEIAQRIDPGQATFVTKILNMQNLEQQKFDSTAARALPKFASIMKSIICPRTRSWAKFCTTDPDLTFYFQDYFDEVTSIISKYRYTNKSGFDSAVDTMFTGAGMFGQMPFFVDNRPEGIYYRTFPMSEVWAKTNAYGEKDTFVRKFKLDKRQAEELFGDKCPAKIKESKDCNMQYEFLHYVCPNEKFDIDKEDNLSMKYSSYYLCADTCEIVNVGGYHTMPYCMARVEVFPTEKVYGYGPAMKCLADQKTLNAAMRITMRGAELSADPELLVREDAVVNLNQLGAAGSVIYGGLDEQGKPAAASMQRNMDLRAMEVLRQELKQNIADGFCINLLEILINDPSAKTATEVMVKKQEQAILLAPMATRIYQEWAAVCCMREFDIHDRAGRLPEMPEDLRAELIRSKSKLTIEFESPLDEAQKSEEAIKLNRYLETVSGYAQVFPDMLNVINPTETAKIMAKSIGVPAKAIRSDEELKQVEQQKIEAAQAQQMLAAMPTVAKSASDLAKANVEAQSGIKLI